MRAVRLAAGLALAAWTGVGLLTTATRLAGGAGFGVGRQPAAAAVVGMPLPGAAAVSALRELLPPPAREHTLLVVLEADAPAMEARYIHYQLAQLRYPERIDVVRLGERTIDASRFTRVVAPAGVPAPPGFRAAGGARGRVYYERVD